MAYSPAPLALDRSKPPPWNVEQAFVNPAYQGLWRGLTTLIPLQGEQIPLDFLRREFASTATGDLKAGPRGYGYFTDYASSKQLQWPSSTHTDIGGGVDREFSILVAVDEIVALNGAAGFVAHRDAFNATYWELYYDSGNINFGWSSPFRSVSWPYTLSAGDSPVLVLTRRLGGVYELWVDGVSQGIRSNPVLVGGGAHQFAVGALAAGDTSNNVEATFQMVGLWTGRALSSPEAILLSADPFALIRPNWDYVTAAGAVDVDADGVFAAPSHQIAGTGSVGIEADGSFDSPAHEISGSGGTEAEANASGQFTAPAHEVSGVGSVEVSATGSLTAPSHEASGSGTVPVEGAGSFTAASHEISGSGSQDAQINASGTFNAPSHEYAGSGVVPISGDGAALAPSHVFAGTVQIAVAGDGAYTHPAHVVSGTGRVFIDATGDYTAPVHEVDGQAFVGIEASGQFTAPSHVIAGTEAEPPFTPVVVVGSYERQQIGSEYARQTVSGTHGRQTVGGSV